MSRQPNLVKEVFEKQAVISILPVLLYKVRYLKHTAPAIGKDRPDPGPDDFTTYG